MNLEIAKALEEFKPALAARYSDMVRRYFARMIELHGPGLRGVYNGCLAATYRELVSHNLTNREEICEESLARNAARYADDAIEAWGHKINAKLPGVDNVSVRRFQGVSFVISCTRGSDKVTISQDCIVNVSSKGKPFNQFPSRIYVNGKFTTEAKFKAS